MQVDLAENVGDHLHVPIHDKEQLHESRLEAG
jgi:hypothetical protein